MLAYEWVAYGYFGAVTVLPWTRPLPTKRRVLITTVGLAMTSAALWLRRHVDPLIWAATPLAWILIGYYLSGLFFVQPTARFEAWLVAWDRRVLGDPTRRFDHWPRPWLAFLDILYMGCFLLVPAGAVAIVSSGSDRFLDRYWTMVISAEFGAFLPLTLVQARPPWAIEREPALRDRAVHRAASRFVREVTINANTFPSGHAAGSLAVALAVIGVMPVVGTVLLVLALCICVACIVGRYHYFMDVVAGILLALSIWIIVTLG